MDEHLVISALGSDKPGIISELSRFALEQQCNILDTRMTVLGEAFALLMMVSGDNGAIEQLKRTLSKAASNLELTITLQNTQQKQQQEPALPYHVDVVAIDNPGIVHEITGFFSDRKINIEEMNTGTYSAAHTGTPMFSLTVEIKIPGSINISNLKDEFISFCDERNLDATIEPCK
ncbi:glycine cleavage system protein R [Gammaproteobacteria bacterium 42_54_T18]|nr:glycine cleavage system protein R [Gammaproteobacteria bacterium 42_54_T18]